MGNNDRVDAHRMERYGEGSCLHQTWQGVHTMNARQVKKDVCHHASLVLRSSLDGFDVAEVYDDEPDQLRYVDGMWDLIYELERRAKVKESTP